MEFEGTVNITHAEPFKVELTRGQKGTYGWAITVHASGVVTLVEDIKRLDAMLQANFKSNPPE